MSKEKLFFDKLEDVFVSLYLHTEDKAKVSGEEYRKYWFDNLQGVLKEILN